MASLKSLVESAGSLEEIREGVINLYGEMDPAELGAIIARAMAVAEMAGMAEVKDETGG